MSRSDSTGAGLLAVLFATAPVMAANEPLGFEVTAGMRYTDNVDRVDVNPQSSAIATAGFLLKARHDEGTLTYDADGGLDYLHYFSGTVAHEVLGDLVGKASYAFLPERFVWVADEHFGQINTDYFLPPSPLNRQYVNSFDTGPDVHLPLADATSLRLSGRYGRDDYQTSPLSDNRMTGEGALERKLSEATQVGIGGSRESVKYQSSVARSLDFDVTRYFVSYKEHSTRTKLAVELGHSASSGTGNGSDVAGMTGRLSLEHRLSGYSTVTFSADRAVMTAGQGALRNIQIPTVGTPVGNGLFNGGPLLTDTYTMGWRWERPRTSVDFQGSIEKQKADDAGIVALHDVRILGAIVTHRLTTRADVNLAANWNRDELNGATPFTATTGTIGAGYQYRFSPSLVAAVDLTHTNRSAPIAAYRENVAWLRFGFGPRTASVPMH